jgi:hypothetical protein
MAHVQPHSPTDPAWFRPASPDLGLQGVLAGHQNQLARDQERLLDGQRRLADAQAKFGIGMTGASPPTWYPWSPTGPRSANCPRR